jgi:hypothetical protein
MDPPEPVPAVGDGMLIADLSPDAIDALIDAAGPGTDSPLLSIELRHLDGAARRPSPDHGALAALDAPYAIYTVGMAATPEMKQGCSHRLDQLRAALAPWDGGAFLNFSERPGDTEKMFGDEAYRRLREVKSKYDPDDMMHANHEIPPAA